ncbi:MAG: putative integral rane protein [Frankiales bacterium]|nr:putative integral rane protein [Frankiales bacterium]
MLHLLLLRPTGTDLAAQLARASFAREHPFTPVDLSWYAGVHPYGYSVLSPYVMALLGVALTGLLAAVAGAVLLARLLRDTAHPAAGAFLGAFFSVADVVSGRTTFALGAVFALAALLVLPRRAPAVGLAVVTGLFSPVAAAFLGLAAAVLVLRRLPGGWTLGIAAALPVLALGLLFPSGGLQPYEVGSAPYAVVAGLVLALLTHSPLLRLGGLVYALSAAFLLLSPDPFGSNILRLGLLLAAPLVVATATEHWRVVLPVVVVLVWWQCGPPYADVRAKPPPSFTALNSVLTSMGVHRVEVVPLRDHGEAAEVAPVVPLARGWSRQIDTARNPLFYRPGLGAGEFRQWLLDNSVGAVALALDKRVDRGGKPERSLLLIGRVRDLQPVWSGDGWRVWRFTAARPVVGGPVQVVRTTRAAMTLRSPSRAYVPLEIRWSHWLSVSGPACVERNGDDTRIRFRGPGTAVVSSSLSPHGHC